MDFTDTAPKEVAVTTWPVFEHMDTLGPKAWQ